MSFDISTLSVNETKEIQLRHPATDELLMNDGKVMSITVHGPGSKVFAKARSVAENKAVDRIKKKGNTDQTPEQKQENAAEFLAACTVSLNNFDYKGGADAAAIKAMYLDRKIGFISEQVDKEMGDWANFMKA